LLDGKIKGEFLKFPTSIVNQITKEVLQFETQDQFIEYIIKEFIELKERLSSDKKDVTLTDFMFPYTGENTLCLIDYRTIDLIQKYEYYMKSPHDKYDCKMWFETVRLLNKFYSQRIF
jgi:hypothetical protein